MNRVEVQPATISQVQSAAGGRFVEIHADAGGVVDGLKRLDPNLCVDLAMDGNPPYWHIYVRTATGAELVKSVRAYQTRSGTWAGLDQRIVRYFEEIDGHGRSGYDYSQALEENARRKQARAREKFREETLGHAAELQHALKKDLGVKSRVFVP